MDILSDVLEALGLRCSGVETIALEGTRAGESAPTQAYIVMSGRCALHLGADAPAMKLRTLDGFLVVGAADFRIEPGPVQPHSPTRLLRCTYALDRNLPHPFAQSLPRHLPLRSRYLTDESELGRAVWLLEGELINARLGFDFVALRLAEIILVEMFRRCQLEGPAPAFLAALSDPVLLPALQHIHAKPQHPWHNADLAASVGMSRSVFAERFHRQVGEPPSRYLRHWRMLKAFREIRRSQAPIKDVAEHAGYESAAGFRRAFRRVFHCSPSSLRQPRRLVRNSG